MEIKVLGPDCFNCQKLEELVKVALRELGVSADVLKVTDIGEITKHGILLTPGLVVNGKVKHSGRTVPDLDTIKALIRSER